MNQKLREAKEAKYKEANLDVRSVCSGRFYKKNDKTYEQCKNCTNCFKYKSYKSKSEDAPEVKFHYIDTFRKCKLYEEKYITSEDIIMVSIYNVIYVNDLACASIIALQSLIQAQDKETKKIYGALRKRQKQYERDVTHIVGRNLDILADFNANMDDYINPKLDELVNAIEYELRNVENKEFIALVEVARTIVGYSVLNIEKRVKECLRYSEDSVNLRGYKFTDALRIVENLSEWVVRHNKCGSIDLNKSERVVAAYRDLDKTLTSYDIIKKCIDNSKGN